MISENTPGRSRIDRCGRDGGLLRCLANLRSCCGKKRDQPDMLKRYLSLANFRGLVSPTLLDSKVGTVTRQAQAERQTGETKVTVDLSIDGARESQISTGIGFFDHMLTLLAFHAGWDLTVDASGDLEVDFHHTVEDCGILLGQVFSDAIGDAKGIARFGHAYVPLNESLGRAVSDVCGRAHLEIAAYYPTPTCGDFPVELVEEFFRSFVGNAGVTLHLDLLRCRNSHHGAEVLFKACGRALAQSVVMVGDAVLSTKGSLKG